MQEPNADFKLRLPIICSFPFVFCVPVVLAGIYDVRKPPLRANDDERLKTRRMLRCLSVIKTMK